MKLNKVAKLFTTGFLGLWLVGCSSTPTTETETQAESKEVMDKSVVETSVAESAPAASTDLSEKQAEVESLVVLFDFDRSEVKSQFYDVIKANAAFMMENPSANVTVSGHCDERGTREYNLALGERRANAVKSALVAEGVSAERISVISFGEDNPVAMGHNEAAWSKNRRAEFAY